MYFINRALHLVVCETIQSCIENFRLKEAAADEIEKHVHFHGAHLCLGVGTGGASLPFWEYFILGLPVKCITVHFKQ